MCIPEVPMKGGFRSVPSTLVEMPLEIYVSSRFGTKRAPGGRCGDSSVHKCN